MSTKNRMLQWNLSLIRLKIQKIDDNMWKAHKKYEGREGKVPHVHKGGDVFYVKQQQVKFRLGIKKNVLIVHRGEALKKISLQNGKILVILQTDLFLEWKKHILPWDTLQSCLPMEYVQTSKAWDTWPSRDMVWKISTLLRPSLTPLWKRRLFSSFWDTTLWLWSS